MEALLVVAIGSISLLCYKLVDGIGVDQVGVGGHGQLFLLDLDRRSAGSEMEQRTRLARNDGRSLDHLLDVQGGLGFCKKEKSQCKGVI